MLAQVMANQAQRENAPPPPPRVPNEGSRIREFMGMNPPEFHGAKVDEDPQEFIDESNRIVTVMRATPIEKAELVAYKLKDVARVWYDQWVGQRGND